MNIKLLAKVTCQYGNLMKNDCLQVAEDFGKQLVKKGLAEVDKVADKAEKEAKKLADKLAKEQAEEQEAAELAALEAEEAAAAASEAEKNGEL